jgi:hypothetical protein
MGSFAVVIPPDNELLLRVFTDVSVSARCHDAIMPE